jgi:hypothetical protein
LILISFVITFDYQDQFFIDNGEMIESFNEVYEKYKETDDPFEQERIEEEFNQTLEEWTVKFNESNHPTYRLGFSEDDLTSKEIFNKTLVVMIIYVIVDVLLYILLFYWQNLMDLIIKVFKLKAPAGWEYREKK